jgi:hypothetical protein
MNFDIRNDVPLPEPDGRAPRGPKLNPIDVEAIAGIKSGLYANALEAAKALAPKYRPNVWVNCSKDERRDIVKDKRRKYANMMARLSPSRP